jgi:3-hydroxyisobutyrate dehydrogenase
MRVFDISSSVREDFSARGFHVANSLAEAASGAEVFFMCLPDAEAVQDVVQGEHGLLHADPLPRICVDLTSSLPSTTVNMGQILGGRGVKLLDAPVSGGVPGAREGKLTVMAGGNQDVLEEVRALLSSFACNVVWAGPLGAGHAVKALNNALSAASLVATAEAVAAGMVQGISAEDAVDVFNRGSSRSQNSEVKYPRDILSGTFDIAFSVGLSYKDVRGACLIAAETGTPVPLMAGVREVLAAVARELGPSADFTRIHEAVVKGVPPVEEASPQATAGLDRNEILVTLSNSLLGVLVLITAEAVAAAKAAGLDLGRVLSIFNLSSGRNECTKTFLPALISGAQPKTGITVAQFRDALTFMTSWTANSRIPTPLASLSRELWTKQEKESGGRSDGVEVLAAVV